MISQFYILSPKGDLIISRDYLGNVPKGSSETFFRKLKFWDKGGKDAPPVFLADGVNYLHVKDGGLLLVATTRENVSPSVVLELLQRIGGIIKDYCGLLSEEAVRKNFVLIYELLDEVIDYGYPQNSSSEALKEFVLNEPIVIRNTKRQPSSLSAGASKGPTGVIKSVLSTTRTDPGRRDDIFVDVVEKVSSTFNSGGYIQNSQIDGSIQVKSFLSGNPPISIALNESLAIGRREGNGGAYGGAGAHDAVMLDDVNFHESVSLHRFETERVLELVPPDGEFAVMNYRSTYSFKPPFRLNATVEPDPTSGIKVIINLRIQAEYPHDKKASGVEVVCAMPPEVQRVSCSYEQEPKPANSQSWDWQEKAHKLVWKFKNLPGGQTHVLRARATLSDGFSGALKQNIGPINLNFAIPNHCTSRLDIRYLKIAKQEKNYSPYRWVRYITMSNSYVIRI